MLELFRDGGFMMIPIALSGLCLLAVAARYAVRPESRVVPLLVALGVTTLALGASGFVIGLMTTARHLAGSGDQVGLIAAVGCGESLANVALALGTIALASIAATVGAASQTRRAAQT